jgi:hypothetical protein
MVGRQLLIGLFQNETQKEASVNTGEVATEA